MCDVVFINVSAGNKDAVTMVYFYLCAFTISTLCFYKIGKQRMHFLPVLNKSASMMNRNSATRNWLRDMINISIESFKYYFKKRNNSKQSKNSSLNPLRCIQWGKKVFSQPPIVQVLPLKKMREACILHHRYTSTMKDKIRKKKSRKHIVGFFK